MIVEESRAQTIAVAVRCDHGVPYALDNSVAIAIATVWLAVVLAVIVIDWLVTDTAPLIFTLNVTALKSQTLLPGFEPSSSVRYDKCVTSTPQEFRPSFTTTFIK